MRALFLYLLKCVALFLITENFAIAETILVGTGGIVEEGDDRIRPAVGLNLDIYSLFFHSHFYGRKYSLVTQQSTSIAMGGRFSLPGKGNALKSLKIFIGAAYLREITKIKETSVSSLAEQDTIQNLGVALGIGWTFIETKHFVSQLNWESHVFPAGTATVFLSTGRKQMLSLTAGVKL